jgi:hypothetical protein
MVIFPADFHEFRLTQLLQQHKQPDSHDIVVTITYQNESKPKYLHCVFGVVGEFVKGSEEFNNSGEIVRVTVSVSSVALQSSDDEGYDLAKAAKRVRQQDKCYSVVCSYSSLVLK